MSIKLNDYINDENRKLTPEQIRQFLIDYGFDDALETAESYGMEVKRVRTDILGLGSRWNENT